MLGAGAGSGRVMIATPAGCMMVVIRLAVKSRIVTGCMGGQNVSEEEHRERRQGAICLDRR